MSKLIAHIPNIWLSILSGVLLAFAWPPLPTAFILFVAFVPLLLLEERLRQGARRPLLKFWLHSLLALFIWNIGTTWWVWYASEWGCVTMLIFNTLLMSLPLLLFSVTKKILPRTSYWSLLLYWLAFEYFHFNWDASWPWLTLGKGLAAFPSLMQWYEYTGEMGGSLWILLVNIAVAARWGCYRALTCFAVPLVLSIAILLWNDRGDTQTAKGTKTVIIQPNIDPYTEKFEDDHNADTYISADSQCTIMCDLFTQQRVNGALMICPETAITGLEEEEVLPYRSRYAMLKALVDSLKASAIVVGAETFTLYHDTHRPTYTARPVDSDTWYDSYNTALLIDSASTPQVYHKSRLVPGVEKMPFAQLGILEQLSIDLGGTSGSLGVNDSAINLRLPGNEQIAPIICYESVFGQYVAEFVGKGANYIAIITNDGWWNNTPGYKQHLLYGAIRAIETRRWIARSANTGISCFIDPAGDIIQPLGWDKRGAVTGLMYPLSEKTFYVRYGDWLAKVAAWLATALLLWVIIASFSKPKNKEHVREQI